MHSAFLTSLCPRSRNAIDSDALCPRSGGTIVSNALKPVHQKQCVVSSTRSWSPNTSSDYILQLVCNWSPSSVRATNHNTRHQAVHSPVMNTHNVPHANHNTLTYTTLQQTLYIVLYQIQSTWSSRRFTPLLVSKLVPIQL